MVTRVCSVDHARFVAAHCSTDVVKRRAAVASDRSEDVNVAGGVAREPDGTDHRESCRVKEEMQTFRVSGLARINQRSCATV